MVNLISILNEESFGEKLLNLFTIFTNSRENSEGKNVLSGLFYQSGQKRIHQAGFNQTRGTEENEPLEKIFLFPIPNSAVWW